MGRCKWGRWEGGGNCLSVVGDSAILDKLCWWHGHRHIRLCLPLLLLPSETPARPRAPCTCTARTRTHLCKQRDVLGAAKKRSVRQVNWTTVGAVPSVHVNNTCLFPTPAYCLFLTLPYCPFPQYRLTLLLLFVGRWGHEGNIGEHAHLIWPCLMIAWWWHHAPYWEGTAEGNNHCRLLSCAAPSHCEPRIKHIL